MSDPAKRAAEARAELQQVLADCAAAMTSAGQIVAASAVALEQASNREAQATANYIAFLERQISNQKQFS
jgi:hypothetical protein